MIRLIYASQAARTIRPDDLRQILGVSQRRNAACRVTGMLCHGGNDFLQCLEGPRDAVNATYARILRDERHGALALLSYGDMGERLFQDWSMGYISGDDPETLVILYNATGLTDFQPASLSSAEAIKLVKALNHRTAMQVGLE